MLSMDDEYAKEILEVSSLDDTKDSQLMSCCKPGEYMEEIYAATFAK